MNNHQQFLASLAAQQNINAQAGLRDDVSINKHQFGANVDLSETYTLFVRKGKKVVESMKVNPKEIEDAIKFAKAQHKGLNVTVEKNGKVVREEWEEYSEPISLSEMNYIGSDKKFGRKFYEKDGQLHVKSKTGTQTQNLGSVDVKSNAKMIRGLKKEETEVEEAKVGDTVHLGHATKGGSGVKGKVVKIDGRNVHIKNDKGAMFKGPMDRVTVGEAIKYDSAGDSTGTVTGKGKRDRGAGGEVKVKYKGSDTYKDGAKLPIKARDIGRLIKTARKKGTKPYDSRNLSNPRLTKDHVEHDVAEGMSDTAKKAAKMLRKMRQDTPRDVHNPGRPLKKSAGDIEADHREKKRLSRREAIEDMTPAQERDADRRLKPTRATVSKVRLRAGEKDVAKSVKSYQSDKGGKPGNTKIRRMRDLKLKLEEMDPTDHVKEKDGKFEVMTKDGNVAASFDNKKEADAYAIKNHKKLMSEEKKKRITKLHGKKYPKGTHYCATHVEHAQFGHGNPIHSQHATPDEFGDIEWYDVMFEHGIEQGVATDDLHIHLGEVHENHDHEEGEEIGEAMGPGIAHKTGMKAAQNTPSMKAYYAKVKREQEARANQIAKEREDGIRSKYEEVDQVDELKMPKNPNNPKIKAAKRKGAERAFNKFTKHSDDLLKAVDRGDSNTADSSFKKGEKAMQRYQSREKGGY